MTFHWSLALAFCSIAQLAVECWWMRPFSVHHAHQNSFDLGEASWPFGGIWSMVDFFRHVVVECGGMRRVLVTASGIAVLLVPSRGAFFGFWHGVLAFLGLGSLKSACRCDCRGSCFGRSIRTGLTQTCLMFVEARSSVHPGNMRLLLNPGGKVLKCWHVGVMIG